MPLSTTDNKQKKVNSKKQERKMQKEHSKEEKKKIKEASSYMESILFVGVQQISFRSGDIVHILEKKDGTYSVVFTIAGMTLEGITESEFHDYYVKPLKNYMIYAENSYFRFLEVPIDFTENIQAASNELSKGINHIKQAIFQNDLDFFEIMQEERLLQTYPVILTDVDTIEKAKDIISFIDMGLASFHPQYFDEKQLKIIVKYFNNPGTRLPAFVAL